MPDAHTGHARIHIRVRVRHEADRSYAVLVAGPDGEVLVGVTRRTDEIRTVARRGAARLLGVAVERVVIEDLVMPRPPYGCDGQWVRITSAGDSARPDDLFDIGAAGQAQWFGGESAWLVSVVGSGVGIYPSEHLDFDAVVTDEEITALQRQLGSN